MAAPVVTVRVSSQYVVAPLSVRVTVTSTESGWAQLAQERPDRMLGPGLCGSNATRGLAGTFRTIEAGKPLVYNVPVANLAYGGGALIPPTGWDNPSYPGYQYLCYDRYSTFNQLRALVTSSSSTAFGEARAPLQRLL